MLAALGLSLLGTRQVATANGPVQRKLFGAARLTILERTCDVNVMELVDGIPALVGYIPLEILDLKPDSQQGIVTPNPEHGGKWINDLYGVVFTE